MNKMIRMLVCLILSLALLFSATSCTVDTVAQEIAGSVADGSDDNGDERSDGAPSESIKESVESEITDSFAKPDEDTEGGENMQILIKESVFDLAFETDEWELASEDDEIFSFAMDCIAYDLFEIGYETFFALAYIGDKYVPGIAYTDYSLYEESEDGVSIYECGFIQIIEAGDSLTTRLTSDDVKSGVAVVPYGESDINTSFVVNMFSSVKSYSAIYQNKYFRYDQTSEYVVEIDIRDNDRAFWDESIDLYNFDESRYIFKGDITYDSVNAYPYYSEEAKAYAAARQAVDQIIALQNKNSYTSELQTIILFSEDVIEEYMLNRQQGTINGFLIEELQKAERDLERNQFLVVTSEGVQIETVIDRDELSKERLTNGIINLLGSALLLAGSIYVACVTFGAGTPLVVGAVMAVSTAGAVLYSTSNIIEASQDIYYGITGNVTDDAVNPMLQAFKEVIPDAKKAEKVYHIFGISCNIVQSLCVPINAALKLSSAANVGVFKTVINVSRALAVEIAKMSITGIVAVGVGQVTNKVVLKISGSENMGKIFGFLSTVVAGMITRRGLQKLDNKYNFSGLSSKTQINHTKGEKENPVKHFSEDKWANLTPNEKKAAIEQLRNAISDDLGLKTRPKVRYYYNSGDDAGYGYYNDRNNTININEYYFDNGINPGKEMLDTVAHELRHASQYANLGADSVSQSYIHYVEYNPGLGNWSDYFNQPCEVDARNYANLWTDMLKGMF